MVRQRTSSRFCEARWKYGCGRPAARSRRGVMWQERTISDIEGQTALMVASLLPGKTRVRPSKRRREISVASAETLKWPRPSQDIGVGEYGKSKFGTHDGRSRSGTER